MNIKMDIKWMKKEYLRKWIDKYKYPLLVCCIGLVLLLLPQYADGSAQKNVGGNVQEDTQIALLEKQMEQLFSQISGVGKVKVMLTLKSSQEIVYAYDTDQNRDQRENSLSQSDKTEIVIVGSGNGETPVVKQTHMPEYMGAVVVCEGADNAKVCLQLTQAVQSLTGITSDHIVISKMQN